MEAFRCCFHKGIQHRQRTCALKCGGRLADALAIKAPKDLNCGILRERRIQADCPAFQKFFLIGSDPTAGSGRSHSAAVRHHGKNSVLYGYLDARNPGIDRERLLQNPGCNRQAGGVILHKARMAVHMAYAHVAGNAQDSLLLFGKTNIHETILLH